MVRSLVGGVDWITTAYRSQSPKENELDEKEKKKIRARILKNFNLHVMSKGTQ